MRTPLVTRTGAGLRQPRGRTELRDPRHITGHYWGPSPWRNGPMDHRRCASIWRAGQAFHMDHHGWVDIAYTSGVCGHGHRFEGRGPGVRTAAQGTNIGNDLSYAVVYIGGDGDPLTDAAKRAFLDEQDRLGAPLNRVHRDWKSTACPGDPLTQWVRAGCPAPRATPPPLAPPAPPPPAPALTPAYQEAEMFLILEGVGIFAVVDGLPVGFPTLQAYAEAKQASPGTPVMTLHGKQAEHMWAWLTAKVAHFFDGSTREAAA